MAKSSSRLPARKRIGLQSALGARISRELARAEAERLACPPTILVVDDEPLLTIGLRGELEGYGVRVEVADSLRDALHCFRYRRGPLSALIIDMGLPEESGHELVRRVRIIDALLPIVLIASLSDRAIRSRYVCDHHLRVIERPFASTRLQSALAMMGVQTFHLPPDQLGRRSAGGNVEFRE